MSQYVYLQLWVVCLSVFLSTVCVIDWYLRVGWLWIKEQKSSLQDFLLPDEEDENGSMMRFAMHKWSLQRNCVRYVQSLPFQLSISTSRTWSFSSNLVLDYSYSLFCLSFPSIIQSNYLLVVKNGRCDDDAYSSYSCRSKEKRLRRKRDIEVDWSKKTLYTTIERG